MSKAKSNKGKTPSIPAPKKIIHKSTIGDKIKAGVYDEKKSPPKTKPSTSKDSKK